ncbi:helix-turn-helix domain-containing protein [Pedobacter roseus]|uniref:Helix-turn-helix transcriptional regulator n=1 Tax=Pedobacter roseus TaxID=336820 RepID=A0A7G9QKU3_9SPHI|nr:helix-turn-helix transcriptional regulator [Pedobacter roseus]QNN43968.1 helix-turn-helix transcriptional regulator [Pedobacter roseus]
MTQIGLTIRKLREEKNISQEKMALELNLAQSNYGRLEKDDRRLTVPKLLKISEVLKVSISDLFNERKITHQQNNDKLTIACNAGPFHDQEAIKKLIEQYELRIKEKDELISLLKK